MSEIRTEHGILQFDFDKRIYKFVGDLTAFHADLDKPDPISMIDGLVGRYVINNYKLIS